MEVIGMMSETQKESTMIQSVREIDPVVLMMEKLERLICEKTAGSIRGLAVEIANGRVVITGQTTRYYNKQLATQAVRELLQNEILVNRIQVITTL